MPTVAASRAFEPWMLSGACRHASPLTSLASPSRRGPAGRRRPRRCLAVAPTARRGDGHPVLVLPGLMTGDPPRSRSALRALGHNVSGWSLGTNRGPTGRVVDTLRERLDRLHRTDGGVSLVGWSLGGLYAQELARPPPAACGLVTLGTPVVRWAPWVRTASGLVDGGSRLLRGAQRCPAPGPSAARCAFPRRRSTRGPTASCTGRRAGTRSVRGGRTWRYAGATSASPTTRRCCGCWPTGWGWPRTPGHRSDPRQLRLLFPRRR